MKHGIDYVNVAVTDLCANCGELNCAKAVTVGNGRVVLPHCYKSRGKFDKLRFAVGFQELPDRLCEPLDGFFQRVGTR